MAFAITLILALILFQYTPPTELPDMLEFLLGAFASVIVQFVKGRFQSVTVRFVIAVLLSIVTGVVAYVIAKPAGANFVVFVIHVFAYSQLVYNAFWKVIWQEVLKFRKFGKKR